MAEASNVRVTRDTNRWEVEIRAEIPAEVLLRHRDEALKEMQKQANVSGFRPGKAPIDHVAKLYGEEAVMREAGKRAIEKELPEILAEQKLPVVETPRVTTEAPESGKPLRFTARAALAPEIELPDYKKIATKHAAEKKSPEVSDEEHAQALTHLRRERARIEKIESGTEAAKAAEEARALAEADLPALDDRFVQSLGYENTEKFAEALRASIKNEKELQEMQKRRAAILDELVKEAKISYPAILLEYELDDLEARLKADLDRIGQTLESFLAQEKKTREEVRESWKAAADKRAKIRLLLSEIARQEHIEPKKEDVDHELEHAKKHAPGADQEILRAHVAHALRNEAVLRFLENGERSSGQTPEHDHEH